MKPPRKEPRTYTAWFCPRCGAEYQNEETPVSLVWHKCPARNGLTRLFTPRKETAR